LTRAQRFPGFFGPGGFAAAYQWALRMHGFGTLPDADALPGKER